MRVRRSAVLLAAAVMLTACAGILGPGKPSVANIAVTGAETLNPNASGVSTPVVVQLYSLRRSSRFDGADFFGLYDTPKETLGDDLIATERMTIRPGGMATRTWTLGPEAKFLGVVAAYRDIDTSNWRAVTELTRGSLAEAYTVRVGDGTVTLARP